MRELERIVSHRHGTALDTDDADRYLLPVAQALSRLRTEKHGAANRDDVFAALKVWAQRWTPLISDDVLRDVAAEAIDKNWMFRADPLGKRLHLSFAERSFLGLRTIGCYDVSRAKRARMAKQRRRDRDRARKAAKRRARGVIPRSQYLAQSLTRAAPWALAGISRRTWERRRKAKTAPPVLSQVCRPIDSYLSADALATGVGCAAARGLPTKHCLEAAAHLATCANVNAAMTTLTPSSVALSS